jgi:hypothetical protein
LRQVAIKPGTLAIEVPTEEPPECFLCTAPPPSSQKDGCDAYLGGFVHGVLAMMGQARPPLCVKHETQLREMLACFCQAPQTFEKLGMTVKVLP